MGFKLSPEAKEYFETIDSKSRTGKFGVMWDGYYFSFMTGAMHRKVAPEPSTTPFVEYFPEQTYYPHRHEILAMLVSAELDRNAIPRHDEPQVRALMIKLLEPGNPTGLKSEGMKRMNCYAEAGFQILRDRVPGPTDLHEFLAEIYAILLSNQDIVIEEMTGVTKGRG